MPLPADPMILLSYINTQLRDFYPSLQELCKTLGEDEAELKARLAPLGYEYSEQLNRFV